MEEPCFRGWFSANSLADSLNRRRLYEGNLGNSPQNVSFSLDFVHTERLREQLSGEISSTGIITVTLRLPALLLQDFLKNSLGLSRRSNLANVFCFFLDNHV